MPVIGQSLVLFICVGRIRQQKGGGVEKIQLAMALIRPCGIRVGELECFEETRSRWCVRLICSSL